MVSSKPCQGMKLKLPSRTMEEDWLGISSKTTLVLAGENMGPSKLQKRRSSASRWSMKNRSWPGSESTNDFEHGSHLPRLFRCAG